MSNVKGATVKPSQALNLGKSIISQIIFNTTTKKDKKTVK